MSQLFLLMRNNIFIWQILYVCSGGVLQINIHKNANTDQCVAQDD